MFGSAGKQPVISPSGFGDWIGIKNRGRLSVVGVSDQEDAKVAIGVNAVGQDRVARTRPDKHAGSRR